jgi:hypothetical protein
VGLRIKILEDGAFVSEKLDIVGRTQVFVITVGLILVV